MKEKLCTVTSLMSFLCIGCITWGFIVWCQIHENPTAAWAMFGVYMFFFVMTMWSLVAFVIADPGFVSVDLLREIGLGDKTKDDCDKLTREYLLEQGVLDEERLTAIAQA